MSDEAMPAERDHSGPRPYWLPADVNLDDLSAELRTAIQAIVMPAYEELVLKADTGLPQTSGLTIVHLLWLEILDQIELGQQFGAAGDDEATRQLRAQTIARLLRVVGAKQKASALLLRLQELKQRWGPLPVAPDPFSPTDSLTDSPFEYPGGPEVP